ncbi:LA_0442/LA_0875 N-terminal domain-containing protein [Leptospira wolffii]|uniref:LA_0442/LA_0875 N-terminal domain-containing protein n=1 Tax=Leptospira wolffii TaxID=409998 RepID=A0ABV5BRZ0_9LEPT|nr:DUF5683 domain-containing protein [Leptospira wolffii]EPG65992.1 hypothetical protein LEP1GSC061_2196 [Leptospira wolffii serovar Khorat str. Khorat-H2]TGL47480.1 hypothetical protein EHQ61_15340 [Leptospira wolffii]
MFSFRRFISILMILFLIPTGIFPVTVLLREGGKVRGEIITQNQHSILLQTEAGKRKIDKDLVLKVLFQDVDDEEEEKIRKDEENKISTEKREIEEKEEQAKAQEEKLKREQEEKEKEASLEEARRQDELLRSQRSRPLKAAMRSAVIPGWGQFYSNRKFQGAIYPTLFAFAAFLAYDKFRVYRNSVTDYGNLGNPYTKENLFLASMGQQITTTPVYTDPLTAFIADQYQNPFRIKREEADRNFNEYQGVLWVAGGIYLINVLDAYLFANSGVSLSSESDGKKQGVILSAVPSPVGSSLGSSQGGSAFGLETKYTLGYRFEF